MYSQNVARVMSKIELSLESNINLITADGMFGFKLKESELDTIIHRLSKNFHNHYSAELANTAQSLWITSQDRKHVHQIFSTAYDIEMEWREKNPLRSLVKVITNPHAYEVVSMTQLLSLPVPAELEIRSLLDALTEDEFRKTPYWRCVNSVTLQLYGGECQVRINDIQCGRTSTLSSEYLNIEAVRGLLHRNYRSDLTVMCEDCRIRQGQVVGQSGMISHRLYVQEK